MISQARRVLFASYVSPFPTNSGERIRSVNLISALEARGYEIEALVGNYDGIPLEAESRNGTRFHQIPFAWPRLRQEAGVYLFPHKGFIERVIALHSERPFDAILLDYGFIGAQIAPLARLGVPIVLGTHNLESALTGQTPHTTLTRTLAIRLRQLVEALHERWFFPRADAILCVSEEDRRAYARFIPLDRLHIVPNFLDIPDTYRSMPRRDRIIMTGSFRNFQNVEGLRWFVEKVWNEDLWNKTRLCVAGNLSDSAVRPFAGVPAIVGIGPREDLRAEIAQSRCAIVPLWHGGGTRLKCLEAMAVSTPVVATSKGSEGIAHRGSICVADTPAAFRNAILELLHYPDRAAARSGVARAVYDREYSLPANAVRLDEAIAQARLFHRQRHAVAA